MAERIVYDCDACGRKQVEDLGLAFYDADGIAHGRHLCERCGVLLLKELAEDAVMAAQAKVSLQFGHLALSWIEKRRTKMDSSRIMAGCIPGEFP